MHEYAVFFNKAILMPEQCRYGLSVLLDNYGQWYLCIKEKRAGLPDETELVVHPCGCAEDIFCRIMVKNVIVYLWKQC